MVWAIIAAWHPFYLGFFSDDWALFIDTDLTSLAERYPNFPEFLLRYNIDPTIISARPGYALSLYFLKSALSDSSFLWQSVSSLLLLAAAFTVYFLTLELLRQYQYRQNECQFGATISASVYLVGPWSIVMGAWPTVAITLISQVFVAIGLTKLISNQTKHPISAALYMLFGFFIYESYWLLATPILIILWATGRWTTRECIRLMGMVLGVLATAILIKYGLSNAWGISRKEIVADIFPMCVQNITSYPRVLGDALQPIPFKTLACTVLAIVFLPLAIEGKGYRRMAQLFGSLAVGLASSALLYGVVGYGIAGTGVMSRTLAAQNVYFSLFIGISVTPALTTLRSLQIDNRRGLVYAFRGRASLLPLFWGVFVFFLLILGTGAKNRANEWITLWQSELSVLKAFPIADLMKDIGSLDHEQKTTVIVQIDADARGEIFGAPWELGPALVWMYPELKMDVESHRLNFLVGRETEWSSLWDGTQIIQRWCNNKNAVIGTAKASRVAHIQIAADGYSRYRQYSPNIETGCSNRQTTY